MQERPERAPRIMRIRRQTAEHPFGTIKAWMGATHFRLRTLEKVSAEMSLHVLAYNLKRMIAILGVQPLIQAMRARLRPLQRKPKRLTNATALPGRSRIGSRTSPFRTASADSARRSNGRNRRDSGHTRGARKCWVSAHFERS